MKYLQELLLLLSVSVTSVTSQCITHGFTVKHLDACDYETLLREFELFFEDPFEKGANCANTAEQELLLLLGATDAETAQAAVDAICSTGYATSTAEYPFKNIAEYGADFDKMYYDGGSFWNEEYATMYGDERLENGDGLSQVLREYAGHIRQFYNGPGRYGLVEFPRYPQFRGCRAQSAYCCWPQDRQANDGNGNCDDPYDQKCIDADPADNTDLCYVKYGNKNRIFFPHDDNNNQPFRAEGPIHCHGFAWSDQDGHTSAAYRGNNLFYVSMYDHFHQRGYVSNIPGTVMCGCTEDMPVASRADCTEMAVEELVYFHYDGTGVDGWSMTVEDVEIQFNACQGINRQGNEDNNDLWAYANRLYLEGRLPVETLNKISKNLVGDNPNVCHHAEQAMMANNRFKMGYEPGDGWVQVAGRDELRSETFFGPISLKSVLDSATELILHRVCQSCEPTHRHVYYKRNTPFPDFDADDGLNVVNHLLYERSLVAGNVWQTDFDMFSTYEDAVAGTNPWKCPNNAYNYGAGFPGECSPTGDRVRNQNSRWKDTGSRRNAAYYLRAPTPELDFTTTRTTNIGGYDGDVSGSAATHTRSPKTVFFTSTARDMWHASDQVEMIKNNMRRMNNMVMQVYIRDFFPVQHWSKTGIMLRESMDPDSRYAAMILSGGNGVILQSRIATGDSTRAHNWHTDVGETTPLWFRVVLKGGNTFTFYNSTDGEEWSQFDESIVIEDFNTRRMVGGVVLTANSWQGYPVEVVFDSFSYEAVTFPTVSIPPAAASSPTTSLDIGNIGNQDKHVGEATYAPTTGVYTVTGPANTDIWHTTDRMHFAYFPRSGDFTIQAYIYNIVEPSNNNGKYGIMIRSSLEANAANAFCLVKTARYGPYGQVRPRDGANTENVDANWHRSGADAAFLRLKRVGNTISFYSSLDGVYFDRFAVRDIVLPNDVYVGMAVSSSHWNEKGTASFLDWEIV